MFKTDIVKRAAAETRLSQRVVSDVIDASLRVIEQVLTAEANGWDLALSDQAQDVAMAKRGEVRFDECRRGGERHAWVESIRYPRESKAGVLRLQFGSRVFQLNLS